MRATSSPDIKKPHQDFSTDGARWKVEGVNTFEPLN
jgi:hypothetical protein